MRIGLLLGLGLIGCTAPVQRTPQQVSPPTPPHWQASPITNTIPNDWLASFADPQLTRWVQTALTHNFDLKTAIATVQAARESANIQGAERRPQLSLSFIHAHGQSNEGYLRRTEVGNLSAVFNLSWELDVWGRLRAAQTAAELSADASQYDYQALRLSIAARTAQSYFRWLEAYQQAAVAEQSVSDRRKIAELIRSRFHRGLVRGLDLRLVLTDVANAEAQLADARNQVQFSQRQLQVLLGQYPDSKLTGETIFPSMPAQIAAGLPAQLLTRRPDLMAAFKRLQSLDAQLFSSEQALLPRLTLTAEGGTNSAALKDIVDPRAAVWNVATGLLQPILAGGRLQGDIRVNRARIQAALNDYRQTALTAFKEVEQTLAAEQLLRDQADALAEAVKQTEASRKLAVYSYQKGLIEILTLLDSFRSTLDTQSAYLAVQRQLLNNRIDLYLSLGGDVATVVN